MSSFLSSLAHAAGNVAAPAAEGAGAALSLGGLVNNSQGTRLTNIGHAISNPNQVLSQPGNILDSGTKTSFSNVPSVSNAHVANNGGTQVPTQTVTTPTGGSSAAGGAASNPNLNQSYIDIINAALGRLPGQEAQAENQVNQQYNQNLNELNSGRAQAQNSYDTSTAQNGQSYVTNKNQIANDASSGLRSLLSILGQHGAGGSSAALYAAPNAVGQVASQQQAGAGQTFGQNQQALDTSYNNYQTGFDNSKKQLSDWLTQQIQGAQSTSEGTRQNLLQSLVGLQPSVAAAQPLVDQINQSAARVNQLGNFTPTYTGNTPVYNAPDVASYTVNQTGAPTLGTPGNNTGAGTPALNFLLGLNKDKNQPSF